MFKQTIRVFLAIFILALVFQACSLRGGSRGYSQDVGYGYNGYYGSSWDNRHYPGYIIDGGGGGFTPPEAVNLPAMGVPDIGGGGDMGMGIGTMDM